MGGVRLGSVLRVLRVLHLSIRYRLVPSTSAVDAFRPRTAPSQVTSEDRQNGGRTIGSRSRACTLPAFSPVLCLARLLCIGRCAARDSESPITNPPVPDAHSQFPILNSQFPGLRPKILVTNPAAGDPHSNSTFAHSSYRGRFGKSVDSPGWAGLIRSAT